MKPEDILPGNPTPVADPILVADPEPAPASGTVHCGFCACLLTQSKGQVLDMSRKAMSYRDTALVIADLRRDSAAHQERAEKYERELAALKTEMAKSAPLTSHGGRW